MNRKALITTTLAACLLLGGVSLDAKICKVRSTRGLRRAIDKAVPGDTIILKKGVYRLEETLVLEGKSDITIIGDGASIRGGVRIPLNELRDAKGPAGDGKGSANDAKGSVGDGKSPASDAKGPANGAKFLDLKKYPISDICPKGHPHLSGPSWSEFHADGVPMRLSEWPDGNPVHLDSVVNPGRGHLQNKDEKGFGTIAFRQDRPLEWKNPTLGWLYGCFCFGWTCELVPIAKMGPGKTIEAGSLTNYGFNFKEGENFQRWKVLNIPEEVTLPGEYSLNAKERSALIMLPEGTRSLELSVMSAPLLKISSCKGITIKGLVFSCSRGDGALIRGCEDVRLEACSLHGLGHVAVVIDAACRRCGLSGCHLYDLGAGAVNLSGGDRKNIIRGDNYVENSRIHNFNRIECQYRVGIVMAGLGNRISACEFYDSASMAILMLGNDQTVEYCNVHHVCMDIEDNGGLYHGRNFSQRGSVIRYNYFHDIEVPFNVRAVYHDDGSGAVEVYGNIFQRVSTPPVQIGGGSYVRYHDNIFLDLDCAAIKIDGRLKTWGADRLPIIIRDSVALVDGPAFRKHYPEFAAYYEGDPTEPQHNELVRTVFYNVKWAIEKVVWSDHIYNDEISGEANFFSRMSDNWKTDTNPGFRNPADPLEGFMPDPVLLKVIPSFQLPPVEKIPRTSKSERTFYHKGFSGIYRGVADEVHTAASSTQAGN